MTPAAASFLRLLQERVAIFDKKAQAATDPYARGLFAGWRNATVEVLSEAERYLLDVENEALAQGERLALYVEEERVTEYEGVPW